VVSCYELGHQPVAVASALASLDHAGFAPDAMDAAIERLDDARVRRARLVAISVPMHTALRIGVRLARKVRQQNPAAHVCLFGLYATLNAEHLLGEGIADSVLGGEFEGPLVDLAEALAKGNTPGTSTSPHLSKVPLFPPRRSGLPDLAKYAKLEGADGLRPAAAVEASRGCLHLCRHCPIPPVYGGRFFVVPRDVVLEDIRNVVRAGARHVTFADPDFLNGPGHSLAIVRVLHEEHPDVTFDFTTKVEHILKHREIFPDMARSGCAFVVSAVESLSDVVLENLLKGHTRTEVFEALGILRSASIPLRPSLLPFTPWATLRDYEDLLDWIEDEDLVDHVDPVQLSIRLLVPPGSPLAEHASMKPHLGKLERENFSWTWTHPDPRMDRLHAAASSIVHAAAKEGENPARTFERLRRAAVEASEGALLPRETRFLPRLGEARPPRLTEPWFC
jgi:radical SAM superfamily enzyme YgiQ (UPF0313 family)